MNGFDSRIAPHLRSFGLTQKRQSFFSVAHSWQSFDKKEIFVKRPLVLFSILMASSLPLMGRDAKGTSQSSVETISLKEIIVVLPNKQEYRPKESLDLTGMAVKAAFSDGTTKTLSRDECQISGFSSEAPGKCTVTVSYTKDGVSKSDSFVVTILKEECRPIPLFQSDSKMCLTSTKKRRRSPRPCLRS